jgi:hypothetical protein
VPFFEAAILHAHKAELEEFAINETSVGEALIQDVTHGDGLGKLARHEATLMNAFTKTLQMLLLLQGNRESEERRLIVESVTLPHKDR